ncbi:MAG: histidine phosphatase family protein [Verrucomicrobia bacterium]|nr:histidine phosphatase family protein [Verrucomicrobiota bacterium]
MLKEKSFYFARHGESEHNARGICAGGRTDSPLTSRGESEAYLLRDKVLEVGIERTICSPLLRAKRTAEIAGGPSIFVEEDLKEIDIGIFEDQKEPKIIDYVMDLPWEVPIREGESKAAFTQKIGEAVNKWLSKEEGTLLFVAHGFVYVALLTLIGRKVTREDLKVKNASLIHFHHDGTSWYVVPS